MKFNLQFSCGSAYIQRSVQNKHKPAGTSSVKDWIQGSGNGSHLLLLQNSRSHLLNLSTHHLASLRALLQVTCQFISLKRLLWALGLVKRLPNTQADENTSLRLEEQVRLLQLLWIRPDTCWKLRPQREWSGALLEHWSCAASKIYLPPPSNLSVALTHCRVPSWTGWLCYLWHCISWLMH